MSEEDDQAKLQAHGCHVSGEETTGESAETMSRPESAATILPSINRRP